LGFGILAAGPSDAPREGAQIADPEAGAASGVDAFQRPDYPGLE